jgi:tRNA(fMet)-specific endonuclease VapC
MDESILDTDILSEVMKGKDLEVLANARQYLAEHQRFAFSEMTVYEIVRGLKATHATHQMADFLRTVDTSDVFPVSRPVLMRAVDLWVDGRAGGYPQDDADLIIAATALETQRVLVTGNTSHYAWIKGLKLAGWRLTTP